MATENVNVRVTGALRKHLQQQIGKYGLYENASEYIRALIRHDLKSRQEAWAWLSKELEQPLRSDESAYVEVTADDVVARNKRK